MCADMSGCHSGGGVCYWHQMVKDADQPHAKNQLSPNVNIAEIWKCLSVANLTHGQHLLISFAFYFNGLKIIRNCSGLGQEEIVPFLLIYPSYK